MQQRTQLLQKNDRAGLDVLEKTCLAQNAQHKDWEYDEEKRRLTRNGDALYMHCLPADISGVSCTEGEVAGDVFEKYRIKTYLEAGYKPYVIAAMMFTQQFENPVKVLQNILEKKNPRIRF
jgi:ornithine carbamoyltransferase